MREISAAYRQNPPITLAMDNIPSDMIREIMRKLFRRWQIRFNEMSEALAQYFAEAILDRNDRVLKRILKEGGIAIEFKMTDAMRDVMHASIHQSVDLIKSIPQQYHLQVEGAVYRSMAKGGDLFTLRKELQKYRGISRARASFIARDQASKTHSALVRVRQQEAGATEAIWHHSGGGHTPRPTHVAAGRRKQRYEIAKGWYDPHAIPLKGGGFRGEYILPGFLPRCRCFSTIVFKGYT